MDAKEINQNFDLVSYVSGLVKLRKNGAYFIGPCPICGGKDRFNIKRAECDLWICRKCTADGKYHKSIDFYMQYRNVDFKQAFEDMRGETLRRPLGDPKPISRIDPVPVQVAPDKTWQDKAWKRIDAANSRLITEKGNPGWQYLAQRGISRGAVFMNLLGYDPAKFDPATETKRPAIVIPWLDIGNVVTNVKYRFIDELAKDKDYRFTSLGGGLPYLFGVQHILQSDHTLLFVEGELNAISVLQTLPRGISVVSAGGETNGNAPLLQSLATHYKRVIIWTDDPKNGFAIQERMNRHDATVLKSPLINGIKWDANEMLCAGLLMDFIARELSTKCLGIPAITLNDQIAERPEMQKVNVE